MLSPLGKFRLLMHSKLWTKVVSINNWTTSIKANILNAREVRSRPRCLTRPRSCQMSDRLASAPHSSSTSGAHQGNLHLFLWSLIIISAASGLQVGRKSRGTINLVAVWTVRRLCWQHMVSGIFISRSKDSWFRNWHIIVVFALLSALHIPHCWGRADCPDQSCICDWLSKWLCTDDQPMLQSDRRPRRRTEEGRTWCILGQTLQDLDQSSN